MEQDQKEISYTTISYAYPPIFIDDETKYFYMISQNTTMIDVH
jgi:hypothetical protein